MQALSVGGVGIAGNGSVCRYCGPMLPGHWPFCEDNSDQDTTPVQAQSNQEGTEVSCLPQQAYLSVVSLYQRFSLISSIVCFLWNSKAMKRNKDNLVRCKDGVWTQLDTNA